MRLYSTAAASLLLMTASLTLCAPVVDPTPDPDPPPPEPVIDTIDGLWYGELRSDLQFIVLVDLILEAQDGDVTGSAFFIGEPDDTVGVVTGVSEDDVAELTITTSFGQEGLVFDLAGTVTDTTFIGTVEDLLGEPGTFFFRRQP